MDRFRVTRLMSLERVWLFWFKEDSVTKKTLWPLTRVWKASIQNWGGAIVGAPPIIYPEYWSQETYVQKSIENDIEKWKEK